MCPQKHSIGALTREEVACPDCPMTNILPEMPSQEAGRIIHHVRWQHPCLSWLMQIARYVAPEAIVTDGGTILPARRPCNCMICSVFARNGLIQGSRGRITPRPMTLDTAEVSRPCVFQREHLAGAGARSPDLVAQLQHRGPLCPPRAKGPAVQPRGSLARGPGAHLPGRSPLVGAVCHAVYTLSR
jgi:hypothetical protein